MDNTASSLLLYGSASVTAIMLVRHLKHLANTSDHPLPLSPVSYPLIGNLFSLPLSKAYMAYTELSKQLQSNCDVISLNFLGTTIVVLQSTQATTDLLEKRSAIYSDRANLPMVADRRLIDWGNFVVFERYGDLFRNHRRMMNISLNKEASQAFSQTHEYHTKQLLQRLLKRYAFLSSSEDLHDEFYRTTAATILHSTYGYRVETSNDPFVASVKELIEALSHALLPTNFLVNVIPALAHVPEWFPGAGWKRKAREWREMKEAVVPQVYQWTKDRIADGTAEPSIIRSMLDYHPTDEVYTYTEENMKQQGISLFGAGEDTLSVALQVIALAMLLYPEAQATAQHEIDTIVEADRLPNLSDRENLPYVRNLVQEVLRWQPTSPVGIPHACYKDDVYRGYRIPKGTIVFGNVWGITRDESVDPDPESFNPDRFLDPSVPPPPAFGWGRRKCPDLYYAKHSLFICIAPMLATFTLSKAKDENGKDIDPITKGAANTVL